MRHTVCNGGINLIPGLGLLLWSKSKHNASVKEKAEGEQ